MSDFKELSQRLLKDSHNLVSSWLPGGKIEGNEYVCGSLDGGPGDSCKINLQSGAWADFAGDEKEKGGDLISLYALVNGISQGDAFKALGGQFETKKKIIPKGIPTTKYFYYAADGTPVICVNRYDIAANGKPADKTFTQLSWTGTEWKTGGIPKDNRPLYNLKEILERPTDPIIITEGEKAADAARKWSANYVVSCWPCGAQSSKKADWSPLYGRDVLLWPDADEAGEKAMHVVAQILSPHGTKLKIVDTKGLPRKFDAADCEFKSSAEFAEWLNKRIKDVAEEVSIYDFELACGERGPYATIDNVLRVFAKWDQLKNIIWYDGFHKKIFTSWNSETPREWGDHDSLELTAFLQCKLKWHAIRETVVNQAIVVHAMRNKRNEPQDWLKSLKWDGLPRCESFLIDCFGAENTAFVRAVSKNWLVSMVARLMDPGCKVDNMVILEGEQGKKKSTALEILANKWFTVPTKSVTEKDFFQEIQGVLIVEFAELDAMSRAEANSVKKTISNRVDRFRVPYQRYAENFPRQCVFVGTTNEDHYLKDHTGGRRFWPVKTEEIDTVKIAALREQLFAEALELYRKHATWWEVPEEEAKQQQEDRRHRDAWEDAITGYLENKGHVIVNAIAEDVLKLNIDRYDHAMSKRIQNCLRAMGWRPAGQFINPITGKRDRYWTATGKRPDFGPF